MKTAITTLLALAATVITLAAQDNATRRFEINVGDFKQLHVDNDIPVDYFCNPDSAGIAVLTAAPADAPLVIFDNNKRGRLAIQASVDVPAGRHLPHVTVYSSSLVKVLNSGDSLVRVNSILSPEKFTAVLIGNGRLAIHDIQAPQVDASLRSGHGQLILSGTCTTAKLNLVGTGAIQADRLKAVNGKASVVGTGTIGCDFTESLTVMGMGSGSVLYRSIPASIKSRGMGIKHGLLDPPAQAD